MIVNNAGIAQAGGSIADMPLGMLLLYLLVYFIKKVFKRSKNNIKSISLRKDSKILQGAFNIYLISCDTEDIHSSYTNMIRNSTFP